MRMPVGAGAGREVHIDNGHVPCIRMQAVEENRAAEGTKFATRSGRIGRGLGGREDGTGHGY